jgi:hypothetical protein
MGLGVDVLLDGVMRTLREAVLPAVEGRFARGQLFAVLDVLQNLRDRVEWRVAFDETEAASAATAITEAVRVLPAAAGAPLARALADAPTAPPAARAAALRAVLVRALAVLDDLPDADTVPARTALTRHLAEQVMRDVALLKPSLLNEISKG